MILLQRAIQADFQDHSRRGLIPYQALHERTSKRPGSLLKTDYHPQASKPFPVPHSLQTSP